MRLLQVEYANILLLARNGVNGEQVLKKVLVVQLSRAIPVRNSLI